MQESTEEGPPVAHKATGRDPPGRALMPCGAPGWRLAPSFCYMKPFALEKIKRRLSGQSTTILRWNLGKSTFALWRSDSARDTSLREGEIEAIDITNDPLIVGGPIFIHIFTSTISSQTLVHLLYSIFVSKPQIGTCGLLVVLITSCS